MHTSLKCAKPDSTNKLFNLFAANLIQGNSVVNRHGNDFTNFGTVAGDVLNAGKKSKITRILHIAIFTMFSFIVALSKIKVDKRIMQ